MELADAEDEYEAMFDRCRSDGLPVVPPTEVLVLRMLTGTTRAPDEAVAVVPPDLVPATVEKVSVNAVLAGGKPEYLRVAGGIAEGVPEKTVAATGHPTYAEVPAGRTADRACRWARGGARRDTGARTRHSRPD